MQEIVAIPPRGIWSGSGTRGPKGMERQHGRRDPRAASQYGYIHRKDDYLKRLRRIEGQARGLQKMVEDEKYCIDILTQVSAMTKALQSVALGSVGRAPEPLRGAGRRRPADRRPTRRSGRPRRPSPGWSAPDPSRRRGPSRPAHPSALDGHRHCARPAFRRSASR